LPGKFNLKKQKEIVKMATIINSQITDAAYIELNYNHEVHALIRFAWINDRLFLPVFFLDRDRNMAISLALADANVEIYSRDSREYFVPCEWLLKQRPELAEFMETINEVTEPFRSVIRTLSVPQK